MEPKKKLGRGLGALIPPAAVAPPALKEGIAQIEVEKIRANPFQPRKEFKPERLAELVSSIREKGILEPLILRRRGDSYEIITGERRFRAAKEVGLKAVPAITREASDNEMLEIALIENLQREDLNALEKAEGYRILIERFFLTQEDLAKKIGMDRATVANTLRLLGLPQEIRDLISEDKLSEGHGRALLSAEDPVLQIALARKAVKSELSVRRTEALVSKLKAQGSKVKAGKDVNVAELENELQELLGTRVRISHRGKKGRIEIEYYSEEEFQRLLEKFRQFSPG
ncbi:hypothetical protein COS16_06310 [Candidatus Desantisbacteria bacterium CG02_land_8_20_14_3_00_49_13]|nr:MAG: hypothetical protein AUJ67_04300 [Candidatus Desantisbacteria bacterium CG1_02_49_89]PIV55698.1 MAG: hypothetical protein COS16_06310 [Candidatus Desantisbacteria bacterium CG02_land_8_20_14_3_00_49_13]PJB27976.1 MAG: hypothetical protein CO111_02760 [Candidatus Desantisbacteria bacterium CG_4_9_14_3_um_filter_50_7]